jgi:hypothetical protein
MPREFLSRPSAAFQPPANQLRSRPFPPPTDTHNETEPGANVESKGHQLEQISFAPPSTTNSLQTKIDTCPSSIIQRNHSKPKKSQQKRSKKQVGLVNSTTNNGVKKPKISKPQKTKKYKIGMHGAKKSEQKRLSSLYNIKISGDSHESEHTIGFEPLNQTSGLKRGTAGRAKELENQAPAYQEIKSSHRNHIGTGNSNTLDNSGFNSSSYRETQRNLIESGDISSAVQSNQLGYAFQSDFQTLSHSKEGQAANDSFLNMVKNMDLFTYAQNNNNKNVKVSLQQKVEMIASRKMAQLGRYLTKQEIGEIYAELLN